jgi:HEAT repeat protein
LSSLSRKISFAFSRRYTFRCTMQAATLVKTGVIMKKYVLSSSLIAALLTPWCWCRADGPASSDPVSRGRPLSAWIEALKDPDDEVRTKAAEAIGALGTKAKAAVPALREAVKDKPIAGRFPAAEALWKVDKAAFKEILTSKEPYGSGRFAVTLALTQIGKTARELTPQVIEMAQDRSLPDREHALLALGFIGADPSEAVPVLRDALQDKRGQYARMLSAQALRQFGPKAKDALPELHQALEDPDAQVRVNAAGAVWKIEQKPEEVVPVLLAAMKDESGGGSESAARQRAIQYIADIGSQAKEAFPVVLEIWKSDSNNRKLAATALKKIDPKGAAKEGVK